MLVYVYNVFRSRNAYTSVACARWVSERENIDRERGRERQRETERERETNHKREII